jgi:hypothetical protein
MGSDRDLFDPKRGLYFAPIRHHSPACAWHLKALLAEVRPRQVLIEAPIDFDPLIPLLLDAGTRPPVAIVAFAPGKDGGDKDEPLRISYYPFSSHAPEYIALVEGRRLGARLGFIDLPAGVRLGLREAEGRPDTIALSFADERPFDMSAYTRALCRRTGCRDQNELWDHLFETCLGRGSWREFFAAVGAYCEAVRGTVSTEEMEADGTLSREAHMGHCLAEALRDAGPIVVVTGGFHTPALIEAITVPRRTPPRTAPAGPAARSYLIRYGFQELDRLNGYAAGLPAPLYYERLWRAAVDGAGAGDLWRSLTASLLSEFSSHLRRERPGLVPPLPAVANALEQAVQLAELRGRPGPTREDLLDAARSSFVKGEIALGTAPVLDELRLFLTGATLGDVPPSAGSPPLLETVRATARRLGFELEFASRKRRELDIYRSERHRQASRFLHAMTFLETGFGARVSGPDFFSGYAEDLLFETWTVAWSPMVEARLIELSPLGDTIEAVAIALLQKHIGALREGADGRGASAAIRLLFTVCQIGLQERAGTILPLIETEIAGDADLASVTRALSELLVLWRARSVLGMVGSGEVERLVGVAYRRALYLMGDLKDTREERLKEVLSGLATLRQVVNSARQETAAVDGQLFTEAVEQRLDDALAPVLAGAVAALAYLAGVRNAAFLVERMRGHLGGAYPDAADNVAALNGMVAIAPELMWRVPELLAALDELVAGLDDERFIAQLPHLRLAFSALNPRETDEVAARIAAHHGAGGKALPASVVYGLGEEELRANLGLSAKVRASLAADGLDDWATARETPP